MTLGGRIRRPVAGGDHPRAWTVALVFAVGLAVGLALVRSSLSHPRRAIDRGDEARAPESPARTPTLAPTAAPARGPSPAPAAPAPAAPTEPASGPVPADRGPASPAVAEAAPPEATTPSPPPPTSLPIPPAVAATELPGRARTLLPGRVAYLQCVGLERPGRDFPCPRDPALEAAAWQILLALPRCPAGDIGAGAADLRLHFGRTGPPVIEVREVPGSPAIARETLLACAGDALVALRTRLRSPRLVLSLRFVTR